VTLANWTAEEQAVSIRPGLTVKAEGKLALHASGQAVESRDAQITEGRVAVNMPPWSMALVEITPSLECLPDDRQIFIVGRVGTEFGGGGPAVTEEHIDPFSTRERHRLGSVSPASVRPMMVDIMRCPGLRLLTSQSMISGRVDSAIKSCFR